MTTGQVAVDDAVPRVRRQFARPYCRWMLAGVAAITALRLIWLALQPADLFPDEAQYWVWSQQLALGYYSKPPLVAWLIAATTGVFGDSEFAVRLSAPLLHAGAAMFVYGIGARLYERRVGFWSAITYVSLPGVSVSAFIISTDAALLFFWAAALYAFIRAREEDGWAWWLAVGLAAGSGLLSKYAMAYWILSALGYVLMFRRERRYLLPLLAAIGVALLLYSPNIWWNWQNGFVSYLHTRDNAALNGPLFNLNAFTEFVASQFGVFGPLLFAGLISAIAARRLWAEPSAQLLAVFALPTLTMMIAVSFLSRAHANWAAPTYVSAIVLVVAWALQRGWRNLLIASIALHIAAVGLLFTGRDALAALGIELPAQYDPLRRVRGWHELGCEVGKVLAAHPELTLFADDREVLAALIYYIRPHPLDAVKWKVTARIQDQWDLTNRLGRRLGDSFLLVSEHELVNEMQPSFAAIDRLKPIVIPLGPGAARTYTLYIARNFKGYPPGRT